MSDTLRLLSQTEFARLYKVDPSTVSRWISEKKLETVHISDTHRIILRDPVLLERFAQQEAEAREAGKA